MYSTSDLEKLEQIVVLKFIGIPLRQIATLVDAGSKRLVDRLRAQRGTLVQKRLLLDKAIAAIGDLEGMLASSREADSHLFKHIIEVIEMNNNPETLQQQYEELLSAKMERLNALSPDALAALKEQWAALVAEIRGASSEDPSGEKAQALGERWSNVLAQLMGQPVDPAALRAHHGAQEWNPRMASLRRKAGVGFHDARPRGASMIVKET